MSEQIFKPENLTVEEIFGNTDSFYRMPEYQRPYSWDKERVEQLWFDIVEAFNNNQEDPEQNANYFLGSLVVVKNRNGSYDVVDGQQRLTTLTILFCVLRDLRIELPEIRKNKIQNSVKDMLGGKERLKLNTQIKNQALFETTVLNGIKFPLKKEDLQGNKFLQNAEYFKELIQDSRNPNKPEQYIENFAEFINYLFEKTTLIRIICNDENFAIKLFSVLNDRGMDLTSADIIKAHLLQKLDESQRDALNAVWEEIDTLCGSMDDSLTNVLNLYLYYLKAGNPKNKLHEELKVELKSDSDTLDRILKIKKFTKDLFEINGNYKDKDISRLKYLPYSIYWKTILLAAKQNGYQHYNELKSLLVKYYYQSWIADGTANRVKQTSFNIIKDVKNNADISVIKERIQNNLKEYPSYLISLQRNNIYSFKWHKPLLLSVEYQQQDDYQFIEITKSIHTEHVLPQEWNSDKLNWKDKFTEEAAKELLNSLGNLTLLSGAKNIGASNRNYLDKREIYEGKGLDGKTSFEITKSILEDYPEEWNEESIKSRYEWLISEIRKIFDIN